MTRRPRRALWILGGIVLLAALARYTGLTQGFPRDFHWDERIYFHEALYGLANGLRRESTVSANLPYLLMPLLLVQWLIGALVGHELAREGVRHMATLAIHDSALMAPVSSGGRLRLG